MNEKNRKKHEKLIDSIKDDIYESIIGKKEMNLKVENQQRERLKSDLIEMPQGLKLDIQHKKYQSNYYKGINLN